MHGRRAGERLRELAGLGHVDATTFDLRVRGAAARPGQQSDVVPRGCELKGHGAADGAGPGDDVDLVHDGSLVCE